MDNLNYGIIGNCKSAALVSETGSIDWCCLPNFDSGSIFAHLLDKNNGGKFAIEPLGDYKISQRYLKRTNVLVTTFISGDDSFEIIDFMPRYKTENGSYHCPPDIVRYIKRISGSPKIRINYDPRPVYSQYQVGVEYNKEFIKHYTESDRYESVYLYSDINFRDILESAPVTLTRDHFMVCSYNQKLTRLDLNWVELEMERTKAYWMGWVAKTPVVKDYQQQVERSALVLKLLAYQKTGAIIASVTTSLPETIGEVRNWDYRYCWLRDASMTINVLTRLQHFNVAKRFLQFILDIIPFKDERIQIMYGIRGQKELEEIELDSLAGYEGSKPVRVGNAAYIQKQNDIYGVVVDVIYQSLRLFNGSLDNKEELWTVVRTLARHVRNNWRLHDSGIWEFRTEKKHFTFSKILCWVAMDRASRIAAMFGKTKDGIDFAVLRDEIKANILTHGCDPETGALTQFYGSNSYDSANLLAEPFGFIGANDPVYVSTVEQTYKRLCVDGLMFRYKTPDDFGTPGSSFIACTFWMIKALYRIGKKDQARLMFDDLLSRSNHLGLFSEDMDFKTKRLLGNFPQGYSHIGLIDTAMTLSGVPELTEHYEQFRP